MSNDESLRQAAELVFNGVNLSELTPAQIIDCSVTCPSCGHGEAIMGEAAPEGGFFETCCQCGIDFVDPTP